MTQPGDHHTHYNAHGLRRVQLHSVDALSHTVGYGDLRDGAPSDIPISREAGGDDAWGSFFLPLPGQWSSVNNNLGQPYLDRHYPLHATTKADHELAFDPYEDSLNPWHGFSGSSKVYALRTGKQGNFRGNLPHDLLPGDWGFRGYDGNLMAVMRGGINLNKVDDLLQTVLIQQDHIMRHISRNYQNFSDWGTIETANKGGNTTLSLKGNRKAGRTYKGEHSFKLDIGAGGNFITVSLVGEDDSAAWECRIDQQGNISMNAAKRGQYAWLDNLAMVIGKSMRLAIQKDLEMSVGGDETLTVGGDSTETIAGIKKISVPMTEISDSATFWIILDGIIDWLNGHIHPGPMTPPFPPCPKSPSVVAQKIKGG